MKHMLDGEQAESYRQDGFLVLKGAIPEHDIQRLERGFARNPPLHGTLTTASYPEPGRYTLANNCLKDPDLAFIVEHPAIISPVTQLLGDDPRLTAYVIYDRTPGGDGLPAHNDYKRWRPVGSSMNWLFSIIPFCDFDANTGPLLVAPGSHHVERIKQGSERVLEVAPPVRPDNEEFIDPGLQRGDLALMNMHLWHRAQPNRGERHRVGLFNKYAAANAPPATGYFLYDEDVFDALSKTGQSLLAVHGNKPLATTRLVLFRHTPQPSVLVVKDPQSGGWMLPGGASFIERAIPDWDQGNLIASLQSHLRTQLRIEPPWVSYVGDYAELDHLCRVYGYTLTGQGFPVAYDGEWVTLSRLEEKAAFGYETKAVHAWLDPAPVRGKGLTQAQCRIDQYAY
jgi:hypothetical protein